MSPANLRDAQVGELEPSSGPPLVSVIVRCHQQGRFLAAAVASARAQTAPPHEIVVVDDGSTDETADVIATLQEQGPLVVVRHPSPLGPALSFNNGVAASTGDLVIPLDADDGLSPRYLELTARAIIAGADLAYGGVERFGAETGITKAPPFDARELGVENFLPVATLFRRPFFDATGGFRPDLDDLGLEDWEFWVHAVKLGARGQPVDGCWHLYRRHAGGSRNSMRRSTVLRIHLHLHRLHPSVVSRRQLARWMARSLRRNLPGGLRQP